MHRLHALVLAPLAVLIPAACSGSAPGSLLTGCSVGASQPCICPESTELGVQICGTTGTFLACICSPSSTLPDAGMDARTPHRDAGRPDGTSGEPMDARRAEASTADVVIVAPDSAVCVSGQLTCNAQTPETCVDGQWVSATAPCSGGAPDCQAGVCACPNTTCGDECVDTTTDPAHCGSCSTPCAYTCTAGACEPLEIEANTGPLGLGIATDGVDVFWLSNQSAATLDVCPVSGCVGSPQVIASNVTPGGVFGNMLAVSAQSLYWTDGSQVMDAPLSGTSNAVFATTTSPQQLVVDATNVYWTDSAGLIYACALGTTCVSPTTLVDLTAVPDGGTVVTPSELAVDATYVYWSDTAGNISSHPLHGGSTVIITASASPNDLVAWAGEVYWTGPEGVFRCAANAVCTPTPYYTEPTSVFSNLVTDGATLYWTTGESPGAVRKCALGATCGAPSTIVDGVDTPSYIVVDAVHTYWLQGQTTGTVYEYAK
jgi:hypothetical protein